MAPFILDFSKKNFSKNEIVLNNSNINFNKVLEGKEIELNKNLKEMMMWTLRIYLPMFLNLI